MRAQLGRILRAASGECQPGGFWSCGLHCTPGPFGPEKVPRGGPQSASPLPPRPSSQGVSWAGRGGLEGSGQGVCPEEVRLALSSVSAPESGIPELREPCGLPQAFGKAWMFGRRISPGWASERGRWRRSAREACPLLEPCPGKRVNSSESTPHPLPGPGEQPPDCSPVDSLSKALRQQHSGSTGRGVCSAPPSSVQGWDWWGHLVTQHCSHLLLRDCARAGAWLCGEAAVAP